MHVSKILFTKGFFVSFLLLQSKLTATRLSMRVYNKKERKKKKSKLHAI